VIADAHLMGLKLETHEGAAILGRILYQRLRTWLTLPDGTVTRLSDFLSFVSRMPLTLELTEAQNFLFALMQERFPRRGGPATRIRKAQTLANNWCLDGDPSISAGALSEIVDLRRRFSGVR